MPNVKVQGPNEVQRSNKKKNEEEWNDGTLEYRIEQENPWILLHYLGIILSNFSHFHIHLTSEICHLKLISSGLFHVPETGIVHKGARITVGAHFG